MTTPDLPLDSAAIEEFEVLLDGLVGRPASFAPTGAGLESGLASSARWFHALDLHDETANPSAAFVLGLEERLISQARGSAIAPAAFPVVLPPAAENTPARSDGPHHDAPTLPRAPRLASARAWLASAAAVLLTIVVAVAAYWTAPDADRDDEGTRPAAIEGGSPAATPAGLRVWPSVAACAVEPRTFDDVVTLLQRPTSEDPAFAVPTPFVPSVYEIPPQLPKLPDGPVPDKETIAAVTATLAEYWGCVFTRGELWALALVTDDGILRRYYPNGRPSIGMIAALGREATPEPTPSRRPAGRFTDRVPDAMRDLRVMPDGRVGAYLGDNGYIVFQEVEGRWLIDDYVVFRG